MISAWTVPDEVLETMGQTIVADSAGAITTYEVAFNDLNLTGPAGRIVEALTFLRDRADLRFRQLVDLTAVDWPQRERRFDVVYHLLSHTRNVRLRLKVQVEDGESAPSVISVFPNADWYEREAFDMYGVTFDGHPDLRRILTDYGFEGHPLRKDFPMSGHVELRYDDEQKRVVYEPISMTEWRNWDFLSPWEGAEYARPGFGEALPGDEKAQAQGEIK